MEQQSLLQNEHHYSRWSPWINNNPSSTLWVMRLCSRVRRSIRKQHYGIKLCAWVDGESVDCQGISLNPSSSYWAHSQVDYCCYLPCSLASVSAAWIEYISRSWTLSERDVCWSFLGVDSLSLKHLTAVFHNNLFLILESFLDLSTPHCIRSTTVENGWLRSCRSVLRLYAQETGFPF